MMVAMGADFFQVSEIEPLDDGQPRVLSKSSSMSDWDQDIHAEYGRQLWLRHLPLGAAERSIQARQQAFFAERFSKVADRTGGHRTTSRSFFGKRRDKNRRHSNATSDQPVLKVDPAQARHSHVSDQARRFVDAFRFQKLFARLERRHLVAKRSYEPLGGLQHRFIIVDYRDQGRPPHSNSSDSLNREVGVIALSYVGNNPNKGSGYYTSV